MREGCYYGFADLSRRIPRCLDSARGGPDTEIEQIRQYVRENRGTTLYVRWVPYGAPKDLRAWLQHFLRPRFKAGREGGIGPHHGLMARARLPHDAGNSAQG